MEVKDTQLKSKTAAETLRENKIKKLSMIILHDEETIAQMEAFSRQLENTDINGMSVEHRTFGAGTVTDRERSSITVCFGLESRKFIMPSAFIDGYLKTNDEAFNDIITRYKDMCKKTDAARREISEMNRSIEALERK